MWLPAAIGEHSWQHEGSSVRVCITNAGHTLGTLNLTWSLGPVRKIALMTLPCLRVNFQFEGLSADARYTFMKRFDLYMQRGGG